MLSDRAAAIRPSATLALNARVKQMIQNGSDIINLTIGEPDFDTPAPIKQAAIAALNDGFTKYTAAEGIEELRAAIAHKLKRDNRLEYSTREIVVSSGTKHALYNAFAALLNPGDEVIIPVPYWGSYAEQVMLAGGVPVVVDTTHFDLDIDRIQEAIAAKTKVILVNSPHNPTGAVYGKESLKALAELAVERQVIILSDEIYEKLVYGKPHYSIAEFAPANTIVVNGFSKTYAMTGWRIGYAAGPEEVIRAMANIQSQTTGNANSIAQKAAIDALTGDQQAVEKMANAFKKRRDVVVGRLHEMKGISLIEPRGAFYAFPDISHVGDSLQVASLLLEKAGVAVVPGIEFGSDRHIRISYATSMEKLEKGLERMERALKEARK